MKVDTIIVGQGLSGSLLALEFLKRGKNILVFEPKHIYSASQVSAGIINPLTGIKFVLSWKYPELEKIFVPYYRSIEKKYSITLLKETIIERAISEFTNRNDLVLKSMDEHYQPYFLNPVGYDDYSALINGYRLDVQTLLAHTSRLLCKSNILREQLFIYDDIQKTENGFVYHEVECERIIFAEGIKALDNPFLRQVEMRPFKGHVLNVYKNDDEVPDKIINRRGKFLVDFDEEWYWFGSHNEKDTNGWQVNPAIKKSLERQFSELYPHLGNHKQECRVGVRPTVRNRIPVVGEIPGQAGMFCLNGLGTKGASLAPWVVGELMEYMDSDKPITEELRADRYF